MKPHEYSDAITHKKIGIIGRYPPPVGGISIHIQRVIAKFKRQHNKVFFFEAGQQERFIFFYVYIIKQIFFLLYARPDMLYYHVLYMQHALNELSCIIFLKRILKYDIIVVDHNCRYLSMQNEQFRKRLSNLMRFVDEHIFIGELTEKSYQDNNIVRPQKWSIQAASLPPDEKDEQGIIKSYPLSLIHFINVSVPLLLVNAFKLCLLPDGKDLYGIDQSINLLYRLKQAYPKVGLLIVLGEYGNREYLSLLHARIDCYRLQHDIYILSGQMQLWPLIKKSDIFLRPTLSDGDSISIREALYFNIPVIASDVCMRPEGVFCYKVNNEDHLYQVAHKVCTEKLRR